MNQYYYIGLFIAKDTCHKYELKVYCNGFLQAFFLLTADAIRSGKHYQINQIECENGDVRKVNNILLMETNMWQQENIILNNR